MKSVKRRPVKYTVSSHFTIKILFVSVGNLSERPEIGVTRKNSSLKDQARMISKVFSRIIRRKRRDRAFSAIVFATVMDL